MADQGETVDLMANQVGGAWEQMLGIATAQGMTRDQILVLTAKTAGMILKSTAGAFWPSVDTPITEIIQRAHMLDGIDQMDGLADALALAGHDPNQERLDVGDVD